ncbi:MAG: energy-coupling factor transporter ATPase [Coriobacteriia bacterium]|nr:energy-coupling factor transporter ATPase [Coriobacteriia bacterium]
MAIVQFDTVSYGYRSQVAAQSQSSALPQQDTPPLDTSPLPHPALDGISLTIERGEFVAVIGANGSGKSTLAKHINALLVPQGGRVLTMGIDTSDEQMTFEIRSHAGMAFQNPDSQMVTSIVADDVAFGPENLAVPHAELVKRVDDALDAVKMTAFAQRNPAHLSGGQKQRICIAGVLAMQPDILILDEPGAMLDARGRRGIRRIVRELNKAGMTVILITHFMEEAVIANRVLVIDRGRIALSGSPTEVFSQKQRLRELALEVPFSLLLAEELRNRGVPVSEIARPEELKKELLADRGTVQDRRGTVLFSPFQGLNRTVPFCPEPSPCPQQPSTLVFDQVSYTYSSHEGKVDAVRNVSFSIEDGDFIGIIGHTGSGKSTLLQLMCGLMTPSSGRVLLNDKDLRDKVVRRNLLSEIGIAFQYPEYQLFAPTVADDIAFGPRNAGLSHEDVDQRVRSAMSLLRLDYERYARLSPFELSGGEMRRVALAGIIALRPRLLILDEPTAGLDPAGRRELLAIIEEYHQQKTTTVMVSHSMDDIARLATKVLVLKDGEAVYFDTPTAVFARARELRAMNLGIPTAASYADELRAGGLPLPEGLLTLEALADAIASLQQPPTPSEVRHGL